MIEEFCIDQVKNLLENDNDVNNVNVSNKNCLHYAVLSENAELAKQLLYEGANVNLINELGYSPLYCAVQVQNVKILELLLHAGADTNLQFKRSRSILTPLQLAMKLDRLDMALILLKHGADPNARNESGRSALCYLIDISSSRADSLEQDQAVLEEYLEAVRALLSRSNEENIENAFLGVLEHGNEVLFREFLDRGLDVRKLRDNSLVHLAVANPRPGVLKMLLSSGYSKLNEKLEDGRTALWVAAHYGHARHAKCLLKQGARPDERNNAGETALREAVLGCRSEVVRLLLQYGAQLEPEILIGALEAGDPDVCCLLLRHLARLGTLRPEIEEIVHRYGLARRLYARCRAEIERMKATRLLEDASLFQVLALTDVEPLFNDRRIVQAFLALDLEVDFPIYDDVLTERFHKQQRRQKLKENCVERLACLLRLDVASMRTICDKIFKYLNKKDIQNLVSL